jgi:DNA-binding SARP family transcriptional activator
LGGLCIKDNGMPVTGVDTPRLQALLAYLLLHMDAPQSRAHLAFLFWPDTSEAQARTNLRNLLHFLRKSLAVAETYLETTVQTLQWKSDPPFILDTAQFEDAVTSAGQISSNMNPIAARQALEQVVALYNGDLLPSCYDDWIIPHREGLRQAYLKALGLLVQLLEEQREYQVAIQHAQRLLREDPLQESTYRILIRLYALNNDRASALRVYHACTTILRRELDVEPSIATREAYQQLLGVSDVLGLTKSASSASAPLVGRDKEWAQLLRVWHSVITGSGPQIVILRGEAGIGKTRMVEELLQWASRQGITCANTRCYAAEGDLPYAPVIAWLRTHPLPVLEDIWLAELVRLLPELLTQRPDLPHPAALTEAWQRQRLFEALSRAITGMPLPLLLTVDDLQWSDRDILEWLHFLLHYDRTASFLVVGTYRTEEVGMSHPLFALLNTFRSGEQLTEIDLHPLDEPATITLGKMIAGGEISADVAHYLYNETEGNPFFVVETVRALPPMKLQSLASALQTGRLSGGLDLPPKVQAVLQARLAQCSPSALKLAGLAATIGREFNFKLLAKTSGEDESHLVHELDELWQRRIVREHGDEAYDFSHDKLREVAYSSMSSGRRRMLHRYVAQALESLYATQLDPISHQIAAHYERAGLPEQAIPYYLRAARQARQVYANGDAIALLKRTEQLLDAIESLRDKSMDEVAALCFEELGDVLELVARHDESLQAYYAAQTRLDRHDLIGQARIFCKIGIVLREQRHYLEALESNRLAEKVLGIHPPLEDTRWWDQWLEAQIEQVWAYYWLAQWHEMEALVNKIRPDVQSRGSPASRMRFLMGDCLLHLRKDRYVVSDKMITNTHEALALSLEWGSLKNKLECQFEVGFLHLWRRELDEAENHLHAALTLAETTGILPMRTLILTYLTVLSRFNHQVDRVVNYVQRAQEAALAAKMPDYIAAARGNQAWIAWRAHDLPAVEKNGQEALVIWEQSPLVYPFQWQALWPLAGMAVECGRVNQAWSYINKLLEPNQQILPEDLTTYLETVHRANARGDSLTAQCQLDKAMNLAIKMGYL